jgi:hypothetical protein
MRTKSCANGRNQTALPNASECYCNGLPVNASRSVTAEESDHFRDLTGLKNTVLRIYGRTLAPNLLNSDAAPRGVGLRRAFGHRGANPAWKHRVGCDSERSGVLGNRTGESN